MMGADGELAWWLWQRLFAGEYNGGPKEPGARGVRCILLIDQRSLADENLSSDDMLDYANAEIENWTALLNSGTDGSIRRDAGSYSR
jgi:hypothetical protein